METPYSFSHIVLAHYKRQAFAQVILTNTLMGQIWDATRTHTTNHSTPVRPTIYPTTKPHPTLHTPQPVKQTTQVLTIAGSLSTLGSPVDLVTSVGTGVKDFFYEPINGLVHSPKV